MSAIELPSGTKNSFFDNEGPDYTGAEDAQLVLDLDGYGGPIDMLLTLARDQKVDLSKISILALADQYLAFITKARQLQLELAADYLVMAAWLAYLKSRLLLPLPEEEEEEPSGEELAIMLRFQLQKLAAMQKVGKQLLERPRLGRDVFARGMPEIFPRDRRYDIDISLYDILRAYGRQKDRSSGNTLRIAPIELQSMESALQRLTGMIGNLPDWTSLSSFLPMNLQDGLVRRSVVAANFAASLELVRQGFAEIRQEEPFSQIYLRATNPNSVQKAK